MIKIEDIEIGGEYRGKTGLPRKVKQFWNTMPGKDQKKKGTPVGADIEYVRVDSDGNEYKGGTCWCSTFANWAVMRLDK